MATGMEKIVRVAMESAGITERQEDLVEVPTPQRAPLLFYPSPSSGTGKFHNIVDGRCEDREIPHLRHADCLASAHGWLLLKNCRSGKLYLFNPSSSKRLPLPRLEEEEEPSVYIFSSAPGRQDCFIVGTYRLCPYFLYSPPRGKRWEKYELNIDQTGCILANTSCNGKVYMFTSKMELAIIDFAPLLSVQYLNTSWIDSLSAYDMINSLVSSSGDLFLVEKYLYHHTEPSIIRTVQVFKLDFSLKTWESVDSINNAVFVVGPDHVESFLAANTGLKGDGIYFVDDDALYCFDLQYRSLTVSYTCSSSYNGWEPFWLLHDDILVNQQERNQVIPNLEERGHFDLPEFVLPPPSRGGKFLQQHAFLPMWCPRNPCLMFTHKNDGTYKILDPCSKNTYELHLPELSGSTILTAKGGWLLARVKKSVLFINPFTKQTVNLPKFKGDYRLFGVAFSSPPTCPDCIVFFITSSGVTSSSETQVTIYIYHSGGKNWITREFENNIPFQPSHSSPVFHNGLFYCLGLNGNCGVYNPREDTWSILSMPVGIHCEAYKCSLVESCGKLLSVFVDRFQELIGVFEFDFARDRWKQITDLVDKMLFFGLEASYCVTASVEEQQNRIYYPSFQREYCLDLVVHSLKSSNTLERCSKTEYLHVWIEPKGFAHVLDPVRGKFYLRIT